MVKKIRIGIIGAKGKMSRAVIDSILSDENKREYMKIEVGIEKDSSIIIGKRFEKIPGLSSFGTLSKLKMYGSTEDDPKVMKKVDVWVDFSMPKSTLHHLKVLADHQSAYVIGTTGFTEAELKDIHQYAEQHPIVMSDNFSIGINLLIYLLETLLKLPVTNSFDIEVEETHHRMKVDAPSGTAKMILGKIQEIKKITSENFIYDRHHLRKPRHSSEVGVISRRGGGVIGEHEIGFFGENEVLSLKHTAINRSAFSYGVLEAIDFANKKLEENKKGLFGIRDVIGL